MGRLVAAREQITEDQARDAVRWAPTAWASSAPDVTLNEAVERHGGDRLNFTLYMVMLCGGLVSTVGDADPKRLKQFDLTA